jgi:hypothetical protein
MQPSSVLPDGPNLEMAVARGNVEVVRAVGTPAATTLAGILMEFVRKQWAQSGAIHGNFPQTETTEVGITRGEAQSRTIR